MGARGNSGVILSAGPARARDTFSDHDEASAADLVAGLGGRRTPRTKPCSGGRGHDPDGGGAPRRGPEAPTEAGEKSLAALLDRAAAAARKPSSGRPTSPVLKEAGVVDAGGQGFALMLDAFLAVVDGRPAAGAEVVATPPSVEAHLHGDDASSLRYEVMYLLEAQGCDDSRVQGHLGVHSATRSSSWVETACGTATSTPTTSAGRSKPGSRPGDPGASGHRPPRQVEEEQWVREQTGTGSGAHAAREAPIAAEPSRRVSSRWASAKGCSRLLNSLGVHAVVAGGQSMNPSTAQILEASSAAPADS